jgi:hypothetical protein
MHDGCAISSAIASPGSTWTRDSQAVATPYDDHPAKPSRRWARHDNRCTGGAIAGWETAMDAGQRCRSKQVYLSKAEAKRVARLMSHRHRELLHLYRCPECGYHHVGHILPAWQRTQSMASQTEASA